MRTAFKLIAVAIVLFLAYKAASVYAIVKFADYMRECLPESGTCQLVKERAPDQEVEVALKVALACARQKQPAVEAVFLPIPRGESTKPGQPDDSQSLRPMCDDWGKPRK